MSRVALWLEEQRRQHRQRQFRAELRRLRMTAGHLRCELFLTCLRAAELMEANDCNDCQQVAEAVRIDAERLLTTDEF